MFKKLLLVPLVFLVLGGVCAAQYPTPTEGDFVIKDFRFTSGEMLPELRVHYRTLGKPQRDAQGVVRNAVLIMHGTGGSGASLMSPPFAGQLFVSGGQLDAERYFLILPDAIGHGRSSNQATGSVAGSRTTGTST